MADVTICIPAFQAKDFIDITLRSVQEQSYANIKVEIFKCKHFPQVSIPEVLASHIRKHTKQQIAQE